VQLVFELLHSNTGGRCKDSLQRAPHITSYGEANEMSKKSISERRDKPVKEHLIKFDPTSIFQIDSRLSILLGRRKESIRTRRGSVNKAFKIIEFKKRKELRMP